MEPQQLCFTEKAIVVITEQVDKINEYYITWIYFQEKEKHVITDSLSLRDEPYTVRGDTSSEGIAIAVGKFNHDEYVVFPKNRRMLDTVETGPPAEPEKRQWVGNGYQAKISSENLYVNGYQDNFPNWKKIATVFGAYDDDWMYLDRFGLVVNDENNIQCYSFGPMF